MDRKGILLPEHEAKIADAIFAKIKWPNKIVKWVSAPALRKVIELIDNWAINRLPEHIKAMIAPFIDAAFRGSIEEVRRLAADLGASYFDHKYLSQTTEMELVDAWTRVLVTSVYAYAEGRRNKAYEEAQNA